MKHSPIRFELTATMIAVALSSTAVCSTAIAQHRAAPVSATRAPASAPVEIEPGVRFGALRLGMTNAQVTAAMPGIPLRPDTREIDRVDGSTSAFIGPYEIVFEAGGALRSVTASLHDLHDGVRINGHTLGPASTPAAVIAVLNGCGTRIAVGGGFVTRCTGADVADYYTAEGLRITVHR